MQLSALKTRCQQIKTTLYQKWQALPMDWPIIKERLLSNIGISVMVGMVVLTLLALHSMRGQRPANETAPALAAWNAPMPAPDKAAFLPSTGTMAPVQALPAPAASANVLALQGQLKDLKNTVTAMNERLLVLAAQFNDEKNARIKKRGARQPYRLLGVHLDQDTNQWVADIEYGDKVQSLLAGQTLDGWRVREVTAQGAIIE